MTYERLRRLAVVYSPLPSEGLEAIRGLSELLADFDRVVREKDDATRDVAELRLLLAELVQLALSERWTSQPPEVREAMKVRIGEIGKAGGLQPPLFPCGCSKHKVNLGRCDMYKPGEVP